MHHSDKDPIIAVATAAGRGGIGILRLSFGKALEAQIVGRLFGENCTLKARLRRQAKQIDLLTQQDSTNDIVHHMETKISYAPRRS